MLFEVRSKITVNIFLFIGGAYGDDYWTQQTPPDADQWQMWNTGETIIFKMDSDMRIYKAIDVNEWEVLKTLA